MWYKNQQARLRKPHNFQQAEKDVGLKIIKLDRKVSTSRKIIKREYKVNKWNRKGQNSWKERQ